MKPEDVDMICKKCGKLITITFIKELMTEGTFEVTLECENCRQKIRHIHKNP